MLAALELALRGFALEGSYISGVFQGLAVNALCCLVALFESGLSVDKRPFLPHVASPLYVVHMALVLVFFLSSALVSNEGQDNILRCAMA